MSLSELFFPPRYSPSGGVCFSLFSLLFLGLMRKLAGVCWIDKCRASQLVGIFGCRVSGKEVLLFSSALVTS